MYGTSLGLLTREARENATIREHTLYSHHFVDGSAALTGLGKHDLHVLASHFRRAAGTLCIQRADVSNELYEARVAAVTDELRHAGIDADRVTINDGMPGGDGLNSATVLSILAESAEAGGEQTGSAPSMSTLPLDGGREPQ